jgi:hypothetical protein
MTLTDFIGEEIVVGDKKSYYTVCWDWRWVCYVWLLLEQKTYNNQFQQSYS